MKLFNSVGPNPKVVRMFMAERGIELEKHEIDIMKASPFQWEEFFDGRVMIANGFEAWGMVVWYEGQWRAIGSKKRCPIRHLNDSDDRALAYLMSDAARTTDPGWSYRHLDSAGVSAVLKELTIVGLGISGRSEAAATLRQLAGGRVARRLAPAGLDAHVDEALAINARIAAEGAASVLGSADGVSK